MVCQRLPSKFDAKIQLISIPQNILPYFSHQILIFRGDLKVPETERALFGAYTAFRFSPNKMSLTEAPAGTIGNTFSSF